MEQIGHSKIISIGSYVPDQIVTSKELLEEISSDKRFGIPHNWLDVTFGIIERRVSCNSAKPSDLAVKAAYNALKKAGIVATEIDLIIYCGIDRDWTEPATAHKIQLEIGANASCFDVSSACHGFMNGLAVADAVIATSDVEIALVVTGEIPTQSVTLPSLEILKKTKDINRFNKLVGMLTVGDAGAAMLIARKNEDTAGFKRFIFKSNGKYSDLCYYRYDNEGNLDAQMIMEKISAVGINMHRQLIDKTYRLLDWEPGDVDYLICHQVGKKPIDKQAALSNVPKSKLLTTYKYYGNTTSASVPFTLSLASLEKGNRFLLLGAGSGLSVSQTGVTF